MAQPDSVYDDEAFVKSEIKTARQALQVNSKLQNGSFGKSSSFIRANPRDRIEEFGEYLNFRVRDLSNAINDAKICFDVSSQGSIFTKHPK